MQLGIFAKTFPGKTAREVLRATRAAGFSCAQYNLACSGLPSMADEVPHAVIADIAAAAKETGVQLVALSATWNMAHPDEVVRERGLRQFAVMAPVAKELNIPLITLCTGTRDAADQWHHHPDNETQLAWDDMCASMAEVLKIAAAFNVTLGVEPELANVVSSAAKARTLLDEMKSPRLKIVLDAANLFERESLGDQRRIISEAAELLAGSIAMAHAKDRMADGSFATAGQGVLDYPHFLRTLLATGFDGPLITHGLSAEEAPGVAEFLSNLTQKA
jgi:sugar phosphate isomerase/epimerase